MTSTSRLRTRVSLLALAIIGTTSTARAQSLEWIDQFGTSRLEFVSGVALDGSGNVYVTGRTGVGAGQVVEPLGATWYGNADVFLRKYDASGNVGWTQQVGTIDFDIGNGVATDSLGNTFVGGYTLTDMSDGFNADVMLSNFEASGDLKWLLQFGGPESDRGQDVAADGLGNVYIAGGTTEGQSPELDAQAFLTKVNSQGTHLWTQVIATPESDEAHGVAVAADGSVYAAGSTFGSLDETNLGGQDIFLAKYTPSGTLLWTRQLGTANDELLRDVATDAAGNIYIAGDTEGNLAGASAGGADAFLAKFDADGAKQWVKQFGTTAGDRANSVFADALGNVLVAGSTSGSLGATNLGEGGDAFVSLFTASGDQQWVHQFGTARNDSANAIESGGPNAFYVAGISRIDEGGSNVDAFIAKFRFDAALLEGDYNGSGTVEQADLDLVLLNWGAVTTTPPAGWLNNPPSGLIDQQELDAVLLNWGTTSASAATAMSAVPEASTLLLLLLAVATATRTTSCSAPIPLRNPFHRGDLQPFRRIYGQAYRYWTAPCGNVKP
jgi:hypothetical protein